MLCVVCCVFPYIFKMIAFKHWIPSRIEDWKKNDERKREKNITKSSKKCNHAAFCIEKIWFKFFSKTLRIFFIGLFIIYYQFTTICEYATMKWMKDSRISSSFFSLPIFHRQKYIISIQFKFEGGILPGLVTNEPAEISRTMDRTKTKKDDWNR